LGKLLTDVFSMHWYAQQKTCRIFKKVDFGAVNYPAGSLINVSVFRLVPEPAEKRRYARGMAIFR